MGEDNVESSQYFDEDGIQHLISFLQAIDGKVKRGTGDGDDAVALSSLPKFGRRVRYDIAIPKFGRRLRTNIAIPKFGRDVTLEDEMSPQNYEVNSGNETPGGSEQLGLLPLVRFINVDAAPDLDDHERTRVGRSIPINEEDEDLGGKRQSPQLRFGKRQLFHSWYDK